MMKKLIICAVAVIVIGMASCKPPTDYNLSSATPANPAVPSNPNELVEADVIAVFGLTKGKQSPFEAAGKITSGSSSIPTIVFTQKDVTDYDDEAGTFTVKVKGTKNGKDFEKEITVAGFTNPYAANPKSTDTTGNKGELKLDEGIEHNYSIEKYVEKANADIASFFKAPLTFSLVNGTSVVLGDFPGYELTATLAKEGADKVKIVPVYTVKNHKKVAGGADTVTEEAKYSVFPSGTFAANLTKLYFTEQDVFVYVLNKTPDSVIKAYSDEFASSFYAFTKLTDVAPVNLFDTTVIAPYTALYKIKDADAYMQLDIDCGIANPKNGGIDADDYKGELKVEFCIATRDQIARQNGITASRPITQSGYAKITASAELDAQLLFRVVPKTSSPTAADIKAWERKTYDSFHLLRVNDDGTVRLDPNPLPDGPTKPFCLCVNGEATLSKHLGCEAYGASKTMNNKLIFIQSVYLQKASGKNDLEVQVQLKGSGLPLTIKINPGEAYR